MSTLRFYKAKAHKVVQEYKSVLRNCHLLYVWLLMGRLCRKGQGRGKRGQIKAQTSPSGLPGVDRSARLTFKEGQAHKKALLASPSPEEETSLKTSTQGLC